MSYRNSIIFVLMIVSLSHEIAHGSRSEKVNIRNTRSPDKDAGLLVADLYGVQDSKNVIQLNTPLNKLQVGFLPLPPDYNKLVIPLGNISKAIYCFVHLSIRGVLDVDNTNGIVELDTEIGIAWIDWEIWDYLLSDPKRRDLATHGSEEIILDSEFLHHIWKPDLFIEEMASVERTSILSKLITLRYLLNNPVMPGALNFKARQSFKLRCQMEFEYYPADTQKCKFHLRSYSYAQEQVFLMWNPKQKVFLDELSDPNYSFQISTVEPGEELYDLFTTSQATCCNHQNYSTLTFTLEIRRDLTYHLVQTCLPSVLLVFITWLCFLLPQDMIEARIGISMTTLLTLTALFAAVRDQAPSVSYAMAIDIWMVFCIFLLFVALLLFTVIYWIRRRNKENKDDDSEESGVHANGDLPNITPNPTTDKAEKMKKLPRHMSRYAFVVFAMVFIIFLVLFPAWLLHSSEYLDWHPSEKYNALPLPNGSDENRLFTLFERKFSAKQKKKVVNSLYRFYDLQRDVIGPKLKETGFVEDSEEEEYEEEEEIETTTMATEN